MLKINQKIIKAHEEKERVKGEVAKLLPAHIEQKSQISQRDQIKKRIETLKRNIEMKEKQIKANKHFIVENYVNLEAKLGELSQAMTIVMADSKILQANSQTLKEEVFVFFYSFFVIF